MNHIPCRSGSVPVPCVWTLIHFDLQIGIFVVYFLDTGLGSGWWVMVLYLSLLFAVMVVRGKPYGAEQIVTVLFPKRACCSAWLGPLLAFTWNVVSEDLDFIVSQ